MCVCVCVCVCVYVCGVCAGVCVRACVWIAHALSLSFYLSLYIYIYICSNTGRGGGFAEERGLVKDPHPTWGIRIWIFLGEAQIEYNIICPRTFNHIPFNTILYSISRLNRNIISYFFLFPRIPHVGSPSVTITLQGGSTTYIQRRVR